MTAKEGFEKVTPGGPFGEAFGAVYFNKQSKTLGFRVAQNHLNPLNVCHGGAMATFADYQLAVVKMSDVIPIYEKAPTITLTIDYIGGVTLGAWVEMVVTLARQTKTMIFTQAVISVDDVMVGRANAIYRHYDG